MTDVVTLDLFRILHDPAQLARLHEIQRARLQERALTDGNRPTGMRLSIADPVRRVKAALDPFWALHIDEGVGERGHVLEDYLEVALFHGEYAPLAGKMYAQQAPIQWHQTSTSAFDFVVYDVQGADRVVSCKSSIRRSKPSSANIAQEKRMMAAAGYAPGSVFEVWVIDPSTMRATGPYEYTLTAEDIDEAGVELGKACRAYEHFAAMEQPMRCDEWNDPEAWRRMFGLRSTSGAFHFTTLDACGAIEKRVREFVRTRRARIEAERDEATAKALIRPHVEEQIALARKLDPDVKRIAAHAADQVVVFSLTSNGVMRADERPPEPAADAA